MASRKPAYMPFYGEKFFVACSAANLSPIEERIYLRLMWLQWDRGERLKDDAAFLRVGLVALGLDTRFNLKTITATIDRLVALGKLRRGDGFVWNQKVEDEYAQYLRKEVAKVKAAAAQGTFEFGPRRIGDPVALARARNALAARRRQ